MVATYARPPPMFVKGEGCYLWDVENRKYLDFTAGIAVNALGHCDPEISKIIAQQVRAQAAPGTLFDSSTVQNSYAHIQSLPQPMDWCAFPALDRKDSRVWFDA